MTTTLQHLLAQATALWHAMIPYSHPDQWFMLVAIHAVSLAVFLIIIGIMIAAVNWCLRAMLGRYGSRAGNWIMRTYVRYVVLPLAGFVGLIALLPYIWPVLLLLIVIYVAVRVGPWLVRQFSEQGNQQRRPRRRGQNNRGRRAPRRARP